MTGRQVLLLSLAQALGTALYVALVVLLLLAWDSRLKSAEGQPQMATYWGMLGFLLLFVVSACITGALVLGYPAILVLRQRVRDAVLLLGATVGWLVLLLLGLLALVAFRLSG